MTDDLTALVDRLRAQFDWRGADAIEAMQTALAAAQARIEELETSAVDKASAWDAIAEKNRRLAEVEKERDDTHAALVRRHADLHAAQKERDKFSAMLDEIVAEVEPSLNESGVWTGTVVHAVKAIQQERDAAWARIEELGEIAAVCVGRDLGRRCSYCKCDGKNLAALSDHQTGEVQGKIKLGSNSDVEGQP